ncbi:MAG: hypothetical protein KF830_01380 [Planctomycetes bacterium]|nr:hypothetical protein [Planctomycetota bacterium]
MPATAQQLLIVPNTTSLHVAAFDPVDGSLVDAGFTPMLDGGGARVGAIGVNGEVWVTEQTTDRIVRYSACGDVLGVIGPTFPGGGLDNIRGLNLIGGIVYVANDGNLNGATADSLVTFDTAGNWLATYPLTGLQSPYSIIPWLGDLLVTGSSGGDDVRRFTTSGASVGTFHNSGTIGFAHQISPASDGNVWVAGFSTTQGIYKLDATSGAILSTITASGPRGVYELQNGNLLWTNGTGAWVYDMSSMTSTLVASGQSYHIAPYTNQTACNRRLGAGCHDYLVSDNSSLFQFFADIPSAKAALDGNALQFVMTANGYVATWIAGGAALYVPPTIGATIVANGSTVIETFTPTAPVPVPGGVATQWTVSSEGILTAGSVGNEGTDTTPTLAETASALGLGFYTWFSQNPTEAGSGKVKWEEVGGVLYVTFDGVECATGTPTVAPSTFQWQLDQATGTVTMVWVSMSSSNSTSDMLVGCTLAGAGPVPVSQALSAVTPFVLRPDDTLLMTLSAAPHPVINPSTVVTYTANNVPEFLPGSGIHLGTMFLSVNPLPGGFDVAGILTTVPGCKAYVATLDLDLGAGVNVAPTLSWTFDYDSMFFAPGNVIAAQAVALFDAAFPLANGESGGFLLSNGVLSTTYPQ